MDLGALKIFVAVAEAGSISQAARRLDYVQSNVTARIKHLEDELDTLLFYRKKRGMALTPAGRTLLPYAARLLHLAREARRAVQDSKCGQGSLTIGAMETTAAVRLPSILAKYHQAFPDVELTLLTGTSEDLIARVLDYSLDGAFVGGAIMHPDIEQEPVFDEELVFVTAQHVAALDALPQRTMLVFRQGCTYRLRLEQLLRETGIAPLKIMEFGTVEAILGCVAAGMGVTLFPRSLLAHSPYRDMLRLHPAPARLAHVPTMFIRHRDTLYTRALEAFIELVRQSAACVV
ncbi:MAG: LysR family transcriptional regulator [Chloroflexales bacterium]|nr:LysR family transcriptional regulator [Chloroflexales bacterium]